MTRWRNIFTSLTLPKIITIDNFVKEKYSTNHCYKRVLDASLNHNLVTGVHTNGGSRAIAWFLCIMILKKDVPRLSLPSSKRVETLI
jgi:hypothetical protein